MVSRWLLTLINKSIVINPALHINLLTKNPGSYLFYEKKQIV